MQLIRLNSLTSQKVFEYKICQHESLKAIAILHEIQNVRFINLLLKLTRPASIVCNYLAEQLKTINIHVIQS